MLSQLTERTKLAKIAKTCSLIAMTRLDIATSIDEIVFHKVVKEADLEEVMTNQHNETQSMKTFFSLTLSNGTILDIRTPIDLEFAEDFDLLIYTKADYELGTMVAFGVKMPLSHIKFSAYELDAFFQKFENILDKIKNKGLSYAKMSIDI